jgi:hypothetical protein
MIVSARGLVTLVMCAGEDGALCDPHELELDHPFRVRCRR